MKRISSLNPLMGFQPLKIFGLIALLLAISFTGKAQVDVTATGGSSAATYTTLKLAFDSINTGYHTGTITIALTGNTTETATAALNASGTGGASYTSITISPSGGATRTISGSLAAALIDLNGADNVIIDGLNSGGNALIIDNSNTGASGVSTIRFINDASFNQILNSTIRGASTAVTLGTVLFSTGTTTGNDNNLIQGCTIEGSGATFPANAIASIGTATAGIENSNNFITLNNISNFFSATLITNGVVVGAGNTDWAISQNKLYQTASRTYTTANTHQVISITSGNNHRVDSNTIGYSSSSGTGTYTMTSTVATRLIAIELNVGTTVASSVQFNTITAISLGTSSGANTANGVLCGISVKGGNANIGTIYGNTIGSTTGTGALTATPTTTQGAIVGINSASTGTVNIFNNLMGGFTSTGSTAAVAGGVFGITVSAVATALNIQYNTIGNTTANNMRAGTSGTTTGSSLCAGIIAPSSSTTATYSHNTIQNLSSYGTGTGCYVRGIFTSITAGSTLIKIDTNTVYNLTTNSGLTAETSGQLGAVGILFGSGQNGEAAGNIIHDISITNTGTAATDAAGLVIVANGNPRVFGNSIYKIRNASTSTSATTPGTASGIFIRSGVAASPINIYNNMIALGAGEVTNTAFIGIWAQHGSTPDPIDSFYHNTITIEGVVTSGAQPSFGIARTDFGTTATTVPMIILNNLVTNNRSGGTGKHYAISNNYGATTPSATGWGTNASDYNVLNANASTIGAWGSVDKTFADWKTASASDAHSFTAAPVTYVDNSFDLHLNIGTTANPMESNAYPLANVTVDIDGGVRPGPVGSVNGGGSIPDIGADEFDGVGIDVTAPLINYTGLAKTCSLSDRVVTATIADQTGVYLTGGLIPRIYYKKNAAGTWTSQPGTLMSGTQTNGIWEFPIVVADIGNVVGGDSVYYYIIAQDSGATSMNIGSRPSGVVATDVNNVTTHPTSPNNYAVGAELNGLYTLNAGAANSSTNFQSLASLQNILNNGCVTGPVELNITAASGPYTGALIIPASLGFSATNPFTFNGNNETIQHTPNTTNRHIIKLDGADYVTIKNLHITGLAIDFDWGIHLTNGADHDSILNCVINLSANTSTTVDNSACIVVSASPTDVNLAGNNANYLTIDNNELIGGYQTLIINGSATNNSMHNRITNNIIRDFYLIGTELTYNDSTVYEYNNTSRAVRTAVSTFEGIEMGAGNKQLRINANKFHDTHNAASTQTGAAYGIYSSANDAPVGFENRVTNNLIYNFNSGSGTIYGIYNSGSDGVQYYHNTISLDYAGATAGTTNGFYQTTAASNIDFRNNIISITRAGTGVKYCIYLNTTTSTVVSNKNVLYNNAPAGTNGVGYYSTGQATLAEWQTVNGGIYDLQSQATYPGFDDPLIADFTPSGFTFNDIGDSVGVMTDYDNVARPTHTPDPGAFEFTPPAVDASITWVGPTAPISAGNHTISVSVLNNAVVGTITDIELEYTNGSTIVNETFSGLTLAPSTSQTLNFSSQYTLAGSATLKAYIKSVNGVVDGLQDNDTTANITLCEALAAGTYTIDASLPTGSGNFASFTAAVNQLECGGVTGPVVFDVVPGSGVHAEQVTINPIPGASSVNRITFNGNGDTLQFLPNTSARHILKLDGADYITVRGLHIIGLATDFDWGIHLTGQADHDSIENCIIDLSINTSTTADNSGCIAVSASPTDINLAGNNASHLTVTGCTLIGGYSGAVINGNGTTTQNNKFVNNIVRDFYSIGVEYTQMDSSIILNNDISRAIRVAVTTFEGIEIGAGCKRVVVSKNKIHDTHNSATTQSGTSYGIFHSASDAPVGFENIVHTNLIYNMNSGTGTIYGLYNSSSDGVHYYYNTVDLSAQTSTSGTTRGFYQTTAATNIDFKNNIISITRAGSGVKTALYFGTLASVITSNYNDLYVNAAAGTLYIGYYDGTSNATLADWKLVNGGAFDQQSIDNNPLFNSSQLLIPMPTSAAIGAGTPISGITKDILDSTRHLTTPTIGAYEFGVDKISPDIALQSIANVPIGLNRTLTNFATITDASSIDTNTNKPRLYFRKSTDDNTYVGNTSTDNGWKWTEATNTISPFSFNIDYSILFGGSVNGGDTLQYFVVAQDLAAEPNLSISNGVFAIQPDSVDLTVDAFPVTGSLSYYRILPDLAGGTITVGATGNYLNLTRALEDYIKQYNFTADVLVELLPDYNGSTETFPLLFSDILRSDSSIKITIRPNSSVTSMLTTQGVPPTDMPLIDLNATHHIYFDGRPDGVGDMSNIKWTIRNKRTVATFTPTIRLINDARFNVLEYLNIQSANTLATSGTILLSTTDGVYGNDSNMIRYNVIRDRSDTIGIPANAIYSAGTANATNHYNRIENNEILNYTTGGVNISATGNGGNWFIGNNQMYYNYATAATTAQTSILFAAASNFNTITGNYIGGSEANAGGTPWIHNGNTAFTGITAAFDSLSTSEISYNVIRNITKTSTGAGAMSGIVTSRGNTNIRFNVIGDTVQVNNITYAGTSTFIGISCSNPLANTVVNIEYNRIANITMSNAGTGAIMRAISYTSGSPYPACNILNNKIFNLSTASGVTGYAAGSVAAQGIYTFPGGYGAESEIAYNTIYNIQGTHVSAATNISGITATNLPGTIHHNTIYGITNNSLGAGPVRPTANGMLIRFLDSATIHHNMIALRGTPSDSVQMNGILITGANGAEQLYFFNSVSIENNTGLPVSSFAFHRGENSTTTQSYQPIVMVNNLFINKVTSPGFHYAVGNEGTRPDSSWISSITDYNDFYSVNPANLTLWGTTKGDLATWRTLSLGDAHSVSKEVFYTNTSTADLHLTGTSVGDFDLAGTPIPNFTTDFDGETRNPVKPYMGIDELPSNPVPVQLTQFTAKALHKDVVLNWTTASEINSLKFIIEASADGKIFKSVGNVRAKGSSNSLSTYQFTHISAQADFNGAPVIYYRLISVDIDTKTSVSNIVNVSFVTPSLTKQNVQVAPNPVNDYFTLNINALKGENIQVEIINSMGTGVYSQTHQINEGSNKIDINNIENLPKGIYFVRVILNGETLTYKILKN